MWGNGCCYNGTVTGGLLKEAPTTSDSNYPIPYLGWTEDGKSFLHIGSGTWVNLSGGGGGSGIQSIQLDEGNLDQSSVDLKGDTNQGVKTTTIPPYTKYTKKKK